MTHVVVRLLTLLALVSVACAATSVDGKADLNKALAALTATGKYNVYLSFFRLSGLQPVLARYIQTQPVTMLVPSDNAFTILPVRVKAQLSGSKLVRLLNYHMIIQQLPFSSLKKLPPDSKLPTIYGVQIVKQKTTISTVTLGPPGATTSQMAVVTRSDIAASSLTLIWVHGINNVIIPPGLF
ncbi:unnamed protein product [Closterium sp. NIES-64]|nr:unnamed protein product [Closterium sp. NIES-64]